MLYIFTYQIIQALNNKQANIIIIGHYPYVILLRVSLSKIYKNIVKIYYWKGKDVRPSMVSQNLCSAFHPSTCTQRVVHTHTHTHNSAWYLVPKKRYTFTLHFAHLLENEVLK